METIEKKDLVIRYLQEQIAQADFRAKAYVFDENNHKNPTRNCFVKLQKYLNDFLHGDRAIRWVTITGFRGVGKTTLLSQLYHELLNPTVTKLYLSVDQLTQLIGVSLEDGLATYEELLGTAFERLEKPMFLFLDEIQYDQKWGVTLKSIFDRSNKIFIFATGSSALSLQSNPDIARRTFFEKLYPMSFTEYIKIKSGNKFEEPGLANQIRDALFGSSNGQEVFNRLRLSESKTRKYWTGIEKLEVERYLHYGTLPFAVKLKNEGLVYDQIKKIIDRIISLDVAQLGEFTSPIVSKIPEVLYLLSASDTLNITRLSSALGINRLTLTEILTVMEKTETITRILPYGSHLTQTRRPSKYLFSSPAFRSMYYHLVGNVLTDSSSTGKLLEDTVGLYLTRYLTNRNFSLTFDEAQGGADFIVRRGGDNIIIEVGSGEKGSAQVINTMKRVESKYGLIVSMSPLSINAEKTLVSVPLSYFLLI